MHLPLLRYPPTPFIIGFTVKSFYTARTHWPVCFRDFRNRPHSPTPPSIHPTPAFIRLFLKAVSATPAGTVSRAFLDFGASSSLSVLVKSVDIAPGGTDRRVCRDFGTCSFFIDFAGTSVTTTPASAGKAPATSAPAPYMVLR